MHNQTRQVNRESLLARCTTFEPHTNVGEVSDELLDKFCSERGSTFLNTMKLMQQFGTMSLEDGAQSTVKQLSIVQSGGSTNTATTTKHATLKDCPSAWDTGVSFGLTWFRGDSLGYIKCKIMV